MSDEPDLDWRTATKSAILVTEYDADGLRLALGDGGLDYIWQTWDQVTDLINQLVETMAFRE